MPLKDKSYQKRTSGKRKIEFLQFFSGVKCSIHFVCPGVTNVHSRWTAGVRYPLYACRFIIREFCGFTYRITSPWAGAKAPALFLCSSFQGGHASYHSTGPAIRPFFLSILSLSRVGLPEEDLSGSAKLRQGGGPMLWPPVRHNVNNGLLR